MIKTNKPKSPKPKLGQRSKNTSTIKIEGIRWNTILPSFLNFLSVINYE